MNSKSPYGGVRPEVPNDNMLLPSGLDKPLKIVAPRRSGNHLLWETLHINYNLDESLGSDGDQFKYHRPYKEAPAGFTDKYTCILLIRDPRDTLISTWFYWKNSGEKKSRVVDLFVGKTFGEYLRGLDPNELDKFFPEKSEMDMYLIKQHIEDPIQNWLDYTDWKPYTAGMMTYERLVDNPRGVVTGFGQKFNLERTKDRIWTVKHDYDNIGVGYLPRKGVVGDWKNYFTKEDNKYIIERAGDKMKEFGYDVTL